MVTFADTSFLYSMYGPLDCHTPKAIAWVKGHPNPVLTSIFGSFELENALRFSEGRGLIQSGDADRFFAGYRTDLLGGQLVECDLNLIGVVKEGTRLSAAHTLTGGHQSFDILHVAAAKLAKATHFLTFDGNQKALAEKEGLAVPL